VAVASVTNTNAAVVNHDLPVEAEVQNTTSPSVQSSPIPAVWDISLLSVEERFARLKRQIEEVLYDEQDIDGFVFTVIFAVQLIFFTHENSSITARKYHSGKQAMCSYKTSRVGEDNQPSDIPWNRQSMIKAAMFAKRPLLWRDNLPSHFFGKGFRCKYLNYVTQVLTVKDEIPDLSLCLDVNTDEANDMLKQIYNMGVFDWVHLVVNKKIRIIENDKTNHAALRQAI
jgi:hypothetical protein